MATRAIVVVEPENQQAASGQYPLANVLGEGPNVSIRASRREIIREILAWMFAGLSLGAIAWAIFVLGMKLSN